MRSYGNISTGKKRAQTKLRDTQKGIQWIPLAREDLDNLSGGRLYGLDAALRCRRCEDPVCSGHTGGHHSLLIWRLSVACTSSMALAAMLSEHGAPMQMMI